MNLALTPEQQQALQDRYITANDDGTLNRGTVTPYVPGDPGNLTNATQLTKSYTTQYQGLDPQDVQARLGSDPIYKWLTDNNWLTPGGDQPQLGGAYNSAMSGFMQQHPGATFRPQNYDSTDMAHYEGGTAGMDPQLGAYREGGQFKANSKGDFLSQLGLAMPYLAAAGMTAGAGSLIGGGWAGAALKAPGVLGGLDNGGSPLNAAMSFAGPVGSALGFPPWLMTLGKLASAGKNINPINAGMTLGRLGGGP